ncbi:MAG: hypothetical protein LBI28_14020 [Treponema sp.]|jgi:electron transport complex protein RnfA|nr:hypothetical protein [Treponema sp.]
MNITLLLFIYSAFTINLVLQCGLGIRGVVESKHPLDKYTYVKLGIMFFSVILLWFVFSKIISSLIPGIFIYVLLFPVSAVVYEGLEYLIFRYIIKKDEETLSFISFPGGITALSLFICINLADNFFEVVILSFGFIFGIFIVNLIIREIRRRAALEAVPAFLRGKPLVIVAMGMLSLVFTTASFLLFRMIGAE